MSGEEEGPLCPTVGLTKALGPQMAGGQAGTGKRSYFQISTISWILNVLFDIIESPLRFHISTDPAKLNLHVPK